LYSGILGPKHRGDKAKNYTEIIGFHPNIFNSNKRGHYSCNTYFKFPWQHYLPRFNGYDLSPKGTPLRCYKDKKNRR
jgi:hypothetical protein